MKTIKFLAVWTIVALFAACGYEATKTSNATNAVNNSNVITTVNNSNATTAVSTSNVTATGKTQSNPASSTAGNFSETSNATNAVNISNIPAIEKAKSNPASSTAGNLSDPKGSIAYQFELVKAGDYDKLKSCCFTDRVKGNLTKQIVDEAKTAAAKYTMEDLYASAEDGEWEGKKTKKIKMKNGRTLTTLVETDGKWLADTIWFK